MKRGKKKSIKVVFSNRWLYTFIALGIIIIVSVGVYAVVPTTSIPTPVGHSIAELQKCNSNGQILKMESGVWGCGTDTTGGGQVTYTAGTQGLVSTGPSGNTHIPYTDGNVYISGGNIYFRDSANVVKMTFTGSSGSLGVGGVIGTASGGAYSKGQLCGASGTQCLNFNNNGWLYMSDISGNVYGGQGLAADKLWAQTQLCLAGDCKNSWPAETDPTVKSWATTDTGAISAGSLTITGTGTLSSTRVKVVASTSALTCNSDTRGTLILFPTYHLLEPTSRDHLKLCSCATRSGGPMICLWKDLFVAG